MRKIASSPFVLAMLGGSLMLGVACSDDEDDGNGNAGGSSGKGGSSGASGASGSNTGGSNTGGSNTGGSNTGGSNTGGSNTGGSGGKGGGATGGSSTGGTGTSGSAGEGGEDGGMGGVGGTDGGMGGGGGEGGEIVVYDTLLNPGFEANSLDFWEESGDVDASYNQWDGGRNGTRKLGHYRMWVDSTTPPYSVSTFQTVSPIENGTYTFSMWVHRKWALTTQYLYARGHDVSNPSTEIQQAITVPDENGYYQITLSNIVVTSGSVTVGVHTASWAGDWSNMDDATLTKNP